MGSEKINCSELKSAALKANSVCKELEDYSELLTKKVLNKLSSLPGSDSKGYITSAKNAAKKKQAKLDQSYREFENFGKSVLSFRSYAEQKDKEVSNTINRLADPYKKKGFGFGGVVENIGNYIYNFVCVDVVNFISDYVPLGDMFMDGLRNLGNGLSHCMENIRDWFKYGAGQYLKNMGASILKVVGIASGIIGLVATITTLTCTFFIVVGVIGVIAGCAYLIYEASNMAATIDSNMTAMEEHRKTNKGLAHYYAGIDGVKEYTKRTDFGDKETNERRERIANYYDGIGRISGGVYGLANLIVSFEALGNVYGLHGKVVDHDFSPSNVKRNIVRQWYQKKLDAGIVFTYDKNGNPRIGINLLKLSGVEGVINDLKGLEGDTAGDSNKKHKFLTRWEKDQKDRQKYNNEIQTGNKKINTTLNTLFEFLTDGRSDSVKNAETMDQYLEDPKFSEEPGFFSAIVTLTGQDGLVYSDFLSGLSENGVGIAGGFNDMFSDIPLDEKWSMPNFKPQHSFPDGGWTEAVIY